MKYLLKWGLVFVVAYYCSGRFHEKNMREEWPHAVIDEHGALVCMDTTRKVVYLIFSAHDYNDGGFAIRDTLADRNVKGSFFFTGDFYRAPVNEDLIRGLKREGHYLGAHSDSHLLYADWDNRDSTLVGEREFFKDLEKNYDAMKKLGIDREEARFYLPPYEWYNHQIASWTSEAGFQLINYTPGTGTARDYTWPEMGTKYTGSGKIIDDLLQWESDGNLNGAMILIHLGTDPRRKDKLYDRIGEMTDTLRILGYRFGKLK